MLVQQNRVIRSSLVVMHALNSHSMTLLPWWNVAGVLVQQKHVIHFFVSLVKKMLV